MAKKTFFEQVSLARVRQIAARQNGIWRSGPVLCGICGTPVELEQCKTNEDGQAVHEKCYALKIAGRGVSKAAGTVPLKLREGSRIAKR